MRGLHPLPLFVLTVLAVSPLQSRGQETERLVVGPNVNMVSGTELPGGDPFLQRQNEGSAAVSSRNDLHLLGGGNDYRTVDIAFAVPGPEGQESGGDSWLGVFTSTDGGSRWSSTLLPGYPQDPSCSGSAPPALCGYEAGADAVVRAGTHGLFYYSGIVFDRGENPRSAVFVSRFMDLNNDEGGEPVRFIDTVRADTDEGLRFLDKPWIAVDIPRMGAQTVTFEVPQRDGPPVSQTVACGRVYLAYAAITGSAAAGDLRSEILFRSSEDCGTTWSEAVALTAPDTLNQGASLAVSPATGEVWGAWRQFSSIQSFLGEGLACAQGGGFWKNAPEEWPVETITLGGVTYTKAEAIALMDQPSDGDATLILVQQLIPAKLNALSGTDDGLENLIGLAEAWLMAHPLGSDPPDPAREEGLQLKNGLESYNEGGNPTLCGTSSAPTTVLLDDAFLVSKSSDGGQSFSSPEVVSHPMVFPFDQGTSPFSFRSTAYPSIAVDAESLPNTYVVWSQRGLALPRADPETGDSRILISTSTDGTSWSVPAAVDPPEVPGHQIKPSLLFTGGKLVLAYYDFRQDVSNLFERFVADYPLADRLRHTVDVRVAIADPGPVPEFTDYTLLDGSMDPTRPSQQASRYPFVIVGTSETDAETVQLQYMTPNIPMFDGGTKPFMGDYIDVLGQRFVSEADGSWRFATKPGDTSVYHAVWTDNRDVVPPEDGDWTSYVPPTLEGQVGDRPSVFDPTVTIPDCNVVALGFQRTGMRNQNLYTALMTRGLLVAAPGNTRELGFLDGELVQRSFVVFVQNVTDQERRFRLDAGQPVGGEASFDQLTLQTAIALTVPPFSSASRTVYVRAPDPDATLLVLVTEIDASGQPVLNGLTGSVRLNPDPTSPAPDLSGGEVHTPAILNPAIFNPAILNPAIFNPAILNPAILNPAIFNPAIFNPAIVNPAIFNPAIFNPAILNPAIFNPAIFNPAIFNPAILNPAILNPAILNPAILNPAIFNPAIYNPAILNPAILNPAILNASLDETSEAADFTFAVQNEGTTTTAYDLNFNVGTQSDGLIYQLVVFKLNLTPVADGCTLEQEAQQELLVNLLNPEVAAPRLLDPANADPHTATFVLEPGDTVFVTLRVLPDLEAAVPGDPVVDFDASQVSAAVVAQPVDTGDLAIGDTQPAFDSISASGIDPLTIDPIALPDGQVGVPYPPQTFTASGGSGTQVWTAFGNVPPGLSLSPTGVLEGTPTTSGSFDFTVRVTDATQIAELAVSLNISAAVPAGSGLDFTVQPVATDGGQPMSAVEVLLQDDVGAPLPGVSITMSLGTSACSTALLSGGTTAFTDGAGVATFGNLLIDRGGVGYTLLATATGVPAVNATSEPFNVVGFCETDSLNTPRTGSAGALLAGGKILVAGGVTDNFGNVTETAELFDPAGNGGGGAFTVTGSMNTARSRATATRLASGQVLIAAGAGVGGNLAITSAELFDPSGNGGIGSFTPTGDLSISRLDHRATLLPNGLVLITGGKSSATTAELFDPSANGGVGAFSDTGNMSVPREGHTATLLQNGMVLVAGGSGLATAELYDPATGGFLPTGSMSVDRQRANAALLPDGRVLIAGGATQATVLEILSSAEIYDPATGTFSPTGSMTSPRSSAGTVRLPDGKVLLSGGASEVNVGTNSAEIFDPVTETFRPTGSMRDSRLGHSAILLPGGEVLVAGGSSSIGTIAIDGAELFVGLPPATLGTITTFAGGGPNDVSALDAAFRPRMVIFDAAGDVLFTSEERVFRVDGTNTLTVEAGNGIIGFSGDGGPAFAAALQPFGIAFDGVGNLFIADTLNHRIRKVDTFGIITTVAGTGAAGFGGDGGPAIAAQLNEPRGIAVDTDGTIYFADRANHRVRQITPGGVITTVAGTGVPGFNGDGVATVSQLNFPSDVALDSPGKVYIADRDNQRVRLITAAADLITVAGTGGFGFSGDGGPATSALFRFPTGIAYDFGDLYIADSGNHRVRRVDGLGVIATVAGDGTPAFLGDDGLATLASLNGPVDVAVGAGSLFISDEGNLRIREVEPGGTIATLAGNGEVRFSGDDHSATAARLNFPYGIAVDGSGNVYFADQSNQRVRRIDTAGIITTVAGTGSTGFGGDGGPATSAELNFPFGVAVDAAGNVFFADQLNHRVRRVDAVTGEISTVAGNGLATFAGDGGAATAASLNGPRGIALDPAGSLYIADFGNHRVRRVDTSGDISTVAGTGVAGFNGDAQPALSADLDSPWDVCVTAAGDLLIADSGNNRVRRIDGIGTITTVAGNGTFGFSGDGGPAHAAQLALPTAIVTDGEGNLFISDFFNNRVRVVDGSGTIFTAAGTGIASFSGDGGAAASAGLRGPIGLAIDSDGSLLVSDTNNLRIRLVEFP